jgi:molybdopterin/thiamine biosynthesis adenylyltransferase
MLSPEETRRYARHLVLRGIGGEGQQKLKAARVLVIGAGGLGSPVIAYLAAAGVGTIGIADDDRVSLSNLQRQIVHTTARDGLGKTESAAAFVADLNPHVAVEPIAERVTGTNSVEIVSRYDIVVDGSDTFDTRAVVADAAATAGKPLVSGAVSMFDGQVTVFVPGRPQFRDLYPDTPDAADLPACEAVGVLGAVTGVIGTLMAMEAIKLITGFGEPLVGRLLLYDGRAARFTELGYGGRSRRT